MSNVSQQLASGALSGLATTACLQPFDLLKTRMQQGGGVEGLKSSSSKNHSLILTATREVIRKDGWRGLWVGTTPSMIRNVPGVALYMTGITQLRAIMATSPYFSRVRKYSNGPGKSGSVLPTLTHQGNLLAGAIARVSVGFVLNPFSVLKTRYESNLYNYPSMSQAIISLVRGGPAELFKGFWASSLRDAPYAGLFLLSYEKIKWEMFRAFPAITSTTGSAESSGLRSSVIHGLSAASAGALATIATHPFDVIKTRIQVARSSPAGGPLAPPSLASSVVSGTSSSLYSGTGPLRHISPATSLPKYMSSSGISEGPVGQRGLSSSAPSGASPLKHTRYPALSTASSHLHPHPRPHQVTLLGTLKTVLRERGVRGLFDGASLRMSRKVLSSAIGWAVYEGVLIFWSARRAIQGE